MPVLKPFTGKDAMLCAVALFVFRFCVVAVVSWLAARAAVRRFSVDRRHD